MASRSALRSTDPKKVSGELFILTYGGLVSTLLKDYENVDDVNKQVSVILQKLQLCSNLQLSVFKYVFTVCLISQFTCLNIARLQKAVLRTFH